MSRNWKDLVKGLVVMVALVAGAALVLSAEGDKGEAGDRDTGERVVKQVDILDGQCTEGPAGRAACDFPDLQGQLEGEACQFFESWCFDYCSPHRIISWCTEYNGKITRAQCICLEF